MKSTNRSAESTMEALDDQVRGAILRPGDVGYDEARMVWNGVIEKEPIAIAKCAGTADVMAGVEFARDRQLPLSVKCGGHMTTGHAICDDGLVLDLSAMDGVRVDPRQETVRVQGGATWEQVNHEALQFGLVPPGIPDDVGVAGFTLGGGLGVVRRKYGLASDNLREVDAVTADGELVHASEDHNSDLFWGLRGGGGNFGVVTSFEFDCFDEPRDCLTAQRLYPIDAAADVLRNLQDAMADLPDALYPSVSFVTLPDEPSVPDDAVGDPGVSLYVIAIGDPESVRGPVSELAAFGDPVLHRTQVMDYTELFEQWKVPKGECHHWKSVFLEEISEDLVDGLLEKVVPLPTAESAVTIFTIGGAVSRYDPHATAYAHRDASYLLSITAQWGDATEDTAPVTWANRLHETVAPYGTGGEYINNQTDDDAERVRAGYADHYDRLVEVKNEWDPDNLFQLNQTIEPTVDDVGQHTG